MTIIKNIELYENESGVMIADLYLDDKFVLTFYFSSFQQTKENVLIRMNNKILMVVDKVEQ